LPASHQDENIVIEAESNNQVMHIGGFNFLQQNKTTAASGTSGENASEQVVSASGVLKEFNKNTTSDNFKANKKYKYGHVNKSFEPSSAYGK
jgi:hypothetical protein